MRKLTILTDMDDTIENLLTAWIDYLNKKHDLHVTEEDVKEWDISVAFPSLSRSQIFAPLYDEALWDAVYPLPYAKEALQKLKAIGHEIYVVTNSHYKTIQSKLDKVLFRYFPFIDWQNVIVASNKQMIRGDVLIDDAPHNLIGGEYTKILMDAPHNRSVDEKQFGAVRAYTWLDVYNYVLRLAEYKKIEGVDYNG